MKVNEVIIKQGRTITTYIYGRRMLISLLKKFTKGIDLIRSGVTRFATTHLTLTCLYKMKVSLMNMFSFEKVKKQASLEDHKGEKFKMWYLIVNLEEQNYMLKSCYSSYSSPSIGGFRCKIFNEIHI